jgi:CrcB protein
MKPLLIVCLGGALGSGARYLVSSWFAHTIASDFPWGTLAVNATGSFLIALILHLAGSTGAIGPEARLFLTTGVMGGFTTYSAFNYESTELFRGGAWNVGVAYVALTVLGCMVAGLLGLIVARDLIAR